MTFFPEPPFHLVPIVPLVIFVSVSLFALRNQGLYCSKPVGCFLKEASYLSSFLINMIFIAGLPAVKER